MNAVNIRKLPKLYRSLVLFFFIIQFSQAIVVRAETSIPSPPVVNANAVIVLDGRTGQELYSKKPDELIRPDSILPMLIAMVVLDERNPDDFILISQEVQGMTTGISGAQEKIGLKAGERLTIRQVLSSVLLANSQDACKALSSVFATDALFLGRIQEKITSLGLSNTLVTSYLTKDDTSDHTTVKDMALVMKAFLTYPLLPELSQQPAYTFVPNNMVPEARLVKNTNQQINKDSELYFDKAIAGILSESTAEAVAFNQFVAAAQSETGQFIIAIADSTRSADNYTNSKSLFDWAFANYKAVRLIAKDEVLSTLPLSNGVILNLTSDADFWHLNTLDDVVTPNFSLNFKPLDITGEFINKNQTMGSADIVLNDTVQGTVNLLSSESISLADLSLAAPKPSLFTRLFQGLIWVILALMTAGLLILIIRTYNFYARSKKKQLELKLKREALLKSKQAEQTRKAKQQVINRSNF